MARCQAIDTGSACFLLVRGVPEDRAGLPGRRIDSTSVVDHSSWHCFAEDGNF